MAPFKGNSQNQHWESYWHMTHIRYYKITVYLSDAITEHGWLDNARNWVVNRTYSLTFLSDLNLFIFAPLPSSPWTGLRAAFADQTRLVNEITHGVSFCHCPRFLQSVWVWTFHSLTSAKDFQGRSDKWGFVWLVGSQRAALGLTLMIERDRAWTCRPLKASPTQRPNWHWTNTPRSQVNCSRRSMTCDLNLMKCFLYLKLRLPLPWEPPKSPIEDAGRPAGRLVVLLRCVSHGFGAFHTAKARPLWQHPCSQYLSTSFRCRRVRGSVRHPWCGRMDGVWWGDRCAWFLHGNLSHFWELHSVCTHCEKPLDCRNKKKTYIACHD